MMSVFSSVPVKKPKKTAFNLSHSVKMSGTFGRLYPILCEEVVPSDVFRMNTEVLVRFAPLIAPVMHALHVRINYFFVPNRLLWSGWEDFITLGAQGNVNTTVPYVQPGISIDNANYFTDRSLADYLGLSVSTAANVAKQYRNEPVSALPFRAYQLIYNEYYRDQNLSEPAVVRTTDTVLSDELRSITQLRYKAWSKDYFTSALPNTQRGGDVMLPLAGDADVVPKFDPSITGTIIRRSGNGPDYNVAAGDLNTLGGNGAGLHDPDGNLLWVDNSSQLKVDMTRVTAATVNELRQCVALQAFLETNMRAGSRYVESLLAHFGVRSSDARLQRPEFLGSRKIPIKISEVLQTSSTDATTPQANMAGHGITAGATGRTTRFFEEHGWVFGIMSVMPDSAYFQGLPRKFSRSDTFDFYFPQFAHLGEQAILNKELYLDGDDGQNDEPFGYTPRFSEYKYIPSRIAGDMRNTLAFWHFGRVFNRRPTLSESFISGRDVRLDPFAVPTADGQDNLYFQIWHDIKAIRPMPRFGVPRLIG